jgi:predicted ester cyclase
MSKEANIAVVRRLIEEGFGRGSVTVVDELVAPDVIEHQRGLKPGADGTKEAIRSVHAWMSDFHFEIEDLVATDDTVWVRGRARGVNTGSVFGRPPTNRPVDIYVLDIARVENGRIVEHWGVPDQLGMLLQLGLFGRPEGAPQPPAARPEPAPVG